MRKSKLRQAFDRWAKWAVMLAALFGLAACANFRAAGTFEYTGDNVRADAQCKG